MSLAVGFCLLFWAVPHLACAAGSQRARIDDELWTRPVEVVDRFLAQGPKARRKCDLPRVDARNLTWKDLKARGFVDGAVVLTGLAEAGTWLDSANWSQDLFVKNYGSDYVWSNNARYDPIARNEEMTVNEFLKAAPQTNDSITSVGYSTQLIHKLFVRDKLPTLFHNFDFRPTLQLAGARGSGTAIHNAHPETWLALVQGLKAWWIADGPRETEETKAEVETHTAHPCAWLESPPPAGLAFCVQQPGEVMFVGNERMHAICNLDDFTLAWGAQEFAKRKWSPVKLAMHRGDVETVRTAYGSSPALVKREALRGYRESAGAFEGSTALHEAAKEGFTELAMYLLEIRAEVNGPRDSPMPPPLHLALDNAHVHTAQRLLDRRASLNAQNEIGFPPVLGAAGSGSQRPLRFLLELRGNIRQVDKLGQGPLAKVADHGHPQNIPLLLQLRAGVNDRTHSGTLPIHLASRSGCLACVRLLLEARSEIRTRDQEQTTPLWHAVEKGHRSVVRVLLESRADAKTRHEGNMMPLHLAADKGHAIIADLLINSRAKMTATFHNGYNALILAAHVGHHPVVEMLLARRSSPNYEDKDGRRPLHHALAEGHRQVAELLLANGADDAATSKAGWTAFQEAQQYGNDEL